jgi:uncharacterized cupin superfamily protein
LLQGNIHIIEPGVASDGLIEHHGEEMGYVLEGELELRLGDDVWTLEQGIRSISRARSRMVTAISVPWSPECYG